MEIKIGSTLYIGGDSPFYLSPPVQGLDSPNIRTGDGLYAGRDGGFVSGHFYGQRTIVINGFYIGSDCEEASELRETLFGLLRIRYLFPIIITTSSGFWYTEGVVSNVKSDVDSLTSGKYQITLLCPDPILYKITSTSDTSTKYVSQTIEIASGTATYTLNNAGSVEVPPIFLWSGQIEGFSAENTTSDKEFGLDDSVPSGSTVIDFSKRTVLVDDVSYNSHRLTSSSWWSLLPGTNEVVFTNTSEDSDTLTVKWAREARSGI